MKLLCPNCQREITVPDQFAGQQMRCPICTQVFTAPALPSAEPIGPAEASAPSSITPPAPPGPPSPPHPAPLQQDDDVYTLEREATPAPAHEPSVPTYSE